MIGLIGFAAVWSAVAWPSAVAAAADDPLPSWNDGEARRAIVGFVGRVTTKNGPDFVPTAQRVAVFDNDGTLWPEDPIPFQLAFTIDELRRLAPEHPEWKDQPAIRAALAGDLETVMQGGALGLDELLEATHANLTVDDFEARVRNWVRFARHPRFHRPYVALGYEPMRELLDYLRTHGFKTFIVSGGGADFMRVWAEQAYGIPPEQVIGSYGKVRYELRDGRPTLVKEEGVEMVDDGLGKPVAIHRFIGRRPIAAFGNSDGDKAMLEWTTIGHAPSLGVLVRHTDAQREYAHDDKAPRPTGKLAEALADAPKRGWVVVDMKKDWKTVFSDPDDDDDDDDD